MQWSKSDIAVMGQKAELVAETLSALANPNRLLILCQLAQGEKSVNELVESVSLAQSAVSQHLAKMRALRLVRARRQGKSIYYSMASEAVSEIMQTLYNVYCARPRTATPKR